MIMKAGLIAIFLVIVAVALSYFIVYVSSHDNVDAVVDVNTLTLDRGRTVHLLGLQSTAEWDSVHNEAAGENVWAIVSVDSAKVEPLRKMVEGEAVSLEYTTFTPDSASPDLHAYIWLDSDTMLNEWMLTKGYAKVDPKQEHPQKQHFIELQQQAQANELGFWNKPPRAEELPADDAPAEVE
jgi:Staphylococcal nuclease homologue